MAVEISYYDVMLDYLSKWSELAWLRWWFVDACCVDVQLLASYQESLAVLNWSLARYVSWRHRPWQCCILHNSDSMVALLADRHSPLPILQSLLPKDYDCVQQTWFVELFISYELVCL